MYYKMLFTLSFALICSSISVQAVPPTTEESYSADLFCEYLYFASAYL